MKGKAIMEAAANAAMAKPAKSSKPSLAQDPGSPSEDGLKAAQSEALCPECHQKIQRHLMSLQGK